MKKRGLWFLLLLVVVCVVGIYLGCNKKENDLKDVKVAEVTHSIFYAPFYVAIENGYFEEEGINLNLILTSGADKVSAAVLSNDVEIGLAGPESAIYVYNGGEEDYLVTFAGLTKRDGQFIMSRNQENDFSLSNLEGKEILVGRKGGMPALNFLNALKKAGVDQSKVNINYSVEFAALSGSFIGGMGNYVNLFEPTASKLEKEGNGYIVASVGMLSGEVPYTAFYARKSFIDNNTDLVKSFTRAIAKGLDFVRTHEASTTAEIITGQFPESNVMDLSTMVQRYKNNDSWLKTPFISKESYQNLQNIMVDAKLIDKNVSYDDLINNMYE